MVPSRLSRSLQLPVGGVPRHPEPVTNERSSEGAHQTSKARITATPAPVDRIDLHDARFEAIDLSSTLDTPAKFDETSSGVPPRLRSAQGRKHMLSRQRFSARGHGKSVRDRRVRPMVTRPRAGRWRPGPTVVGAEYHSRPDRGRVPWSSTSHRDAYLMGQVASSAARGGPQWAQCRPKTGTVTPDLAKASRVQGSNVEYRTVSVRQTVHVPLGRRGDLSAADALSQERIGRVRWSTSCCVAKQPASRRAGTCAASSCRRRWPGVKGDPERGPSRGALERWRPTRGTPSKMSTPQTSAPSGRYGAPSPRTQAILTDPLGSVGVVLRPGRVSVGKDCGPTREILAWRSAEIRDRLTRVDCGGATSTRLKGVSSPICVAHLALRRRVSRSTRHAARRAAASPVLDDLVRSDASRARPGYRPSSRATRESRAKRCATSSVATRR